jgi:hypothetical protein
MCVYFKVSPIQNEGVINPVLNSFETDAHGFRLAVEPLDWLQNGLGHFFEFSETCQKGLLVIPTIQKNFGPFYLCKLRKVAVN